jgi:hypothetical protein
MVNLIVGLTFFGGGAALLLYDVSAGFMAAESVRWPRVRGVITHYALRTITGVDGGLLYRIDIRYRFDDGSRERLGSRAFFGDGLYRPRPAVRPRKGVAYRIGESVDVSCSPDGNDSVLEPGIRAALVYDVLLAVALMFMGVLIAMQG